ncbi:MAG: A24 family peptidase [Candidatus Atribacteria bacterium]|nr:A24 family peptidase [Candidatus Atribacteria bacterium]
MMLFTNIIFVFSLIVIGIYDYKNYVIPNKLVIVVLNIGIIHYVFNYFDFKFITGLITSFSIYLILYFLFPKGIGFGDVKLAGAIGLFLGFKLTILAILLSFFSGAIVGLLLIALHKKSMKDPIPFGPFLALGAIASLFFGESIINWYLGLYF